MKKKHGISHVVFVQSKNDAKYSINFTWNSRMADELSINGFMQFVF
jgi:hypothetical protein